MPSAPGPDSKRLSLSTRRVSRSKMAKQQADSRRAALLLDPHPRQVVNTSARHIESQARFENDPQPEQSIQACSGSELKFQDSRPEVNIPSTLDAEIDFQDPEPERNIKANSDTEIQFQDLVQEGPGINRSQPGELPDNDHGAACTEGRIEGRRIVDVSYMLDQIHEKLDEHNRDFDCPLRELVQIKSRQYGLQTQIFFQCRLCKFQYSIWTNRTGGGDTMPINQCAVAGTIAMGIGHSQMEEFLASMNIPCMSPATYRKNDMEMVAAYERAALFEMLRAGEEAKKLALERGDFIIHEGEQIPFITVVADCAWMKRSYNTGKYDSLSGVGAIVDEFTGKVIFMGVRNKFCFVCERAARLDTTPNPHACFQNYGRDQASTGMEADILVEGFQKSVEMHGLIYKTLIADGDSNTYKSIRDNNPYGKYSIVVEKKECVNHLLRNLTRKVKAVAQTPGPKIAKLKKLVKGSAKKFRDTIDAAVKHRRASVENNLASQIALLKSDVLNAPCHVFGDHRKCNQPDGFCVEQTTDKALKDIEDLKVAGLFQKLVTAIEFLAHHSDSLIYHANNNPAEAFNSIVCKLNAGKRLNLGMRGSFQGRCAGSVLQFNNQNILTDLHRSEGMTPPATVVSLEARRQRKVVNNSLIRQRTKEARAHLPETTRRRQGRDQNYGPNAEKPDMSVEAYNDELAKHLALLKENQKNRVEIEELTRGQADNGIWKSTRAKMLTASNFGKVCRMRETTPRAATVKSILYPTVKCTLAMMWGKDKEPDAIAELQAKLADEGNAVTIKPCGLFIDSDLDWLGATPDGIVNETTIVEVKCPYSAKHLHPEDAIQQRVGGVHRYFDANDRTKMNVSHHFYYQVQGQLHVTQAEVCYFAVWTPLGLKYVIVHRDDKFWDQQMKGNLTRFYQQCLLPEMIDGRSTRGMPIREPEYIREAGSHVHRRAIAMPESAPTSEENDGGESLSVGMPASSPRRKNRTRKVAPTKLTRTRGDSESWGVTSSEEHLSDHGSVPLPESMKRRAENVEYSSVSSTDEQCSSTDRVRIPPIKLVKKTTRRRVIWVSSSADEQESSNEQVRNALPMTQLPIERNNAPWVPIRDDGNTDIPSAAEIAIFNAVNKNATVAELRGNILSQNSLLNDTSIAAFLSVIEERTDFSVGDVLGVALPRFIIPSCTSRDINIIGGNTSEHWRCTYFDGNQLFVYDSMGFKSFADDERKFISLRYPNLGTNNIVSPVVARQPDMSSCGVYAAAFATTVVLGGNPSNESYSMNVMEMRNHLLQIIVRKELSAFPSL